MLRSSLIKHINRSYSNLPIDDICHCVTIILSSITNQLAQKGRIEIRDFGNFDLKYHAPRNARNPKTGQKLTTSPKYAVRFKMGKGLKERINPNG